jgi:hypothetical protein
MDTIKKPIAVNKYIISYIISYLYIQFQTNLKPVPCSLERPAG